MVLKSTSITFHGKDLMINCIKTHLAATKGDHGIWVNYKRNQYQHIIKTKVIDKGITLSVTLFAIRNFTSSKYFTKLSYFYLSLENLTYTEGLE